MTRQNDLALIDGFMRHIQADRCECESADMTVGYENRQCNFLAKQDHKGKRTCDYHFRRSQSPSFRAFDDERRKIRVNAYTCFVRSDRTRAREIIENNPSFTGIVSELLGE